MTARFNHTIIASTDPARMALYYRDLLEADDVPAWGPFTNLSLADGVLLQFAAPPFESPRSTTPSCSTIPTSTAPARRSPSTGPTRHGPARARSTPSMAAGASTSSIPPATSWNC